MAAKQLKDYLETGPYRQLCQHADRGACRLLAGIRIAVIHKNTTGMVGKMTALLAETGANITDMVNKSQRRICLYGHQS